MNYDAAVVGNIYNFFGDWKLSFYDIDNLGEGGQFEWLGDHNVEFFLLLEKREIPEEKIENTIYFNNKMYAMRIISFGTELSGWIISQKPSFDSFVSYGAYEL